MMYVGKKPGYPGIYSMNLPLIRTLSFHDLNSYSTWVFIFHEHPIGFSRYSPIISHDLPIDVGLTTMFPVVFQWFSHGFPMVFPWRSCAKRSRIRPQNFRRQVSRGPLWRFQGRCPGIPAQGSHWLSYGHWLSGWWARGWTPLKKIRVRQLGW